MIKLRRANERGHFDHGWLRTSHTFSFGEYYDPEYTQFRALRVMNEDWVLPGQGFGMHGHRDMEIVTYILEGTLEHRDSLGNGSLIRTGELQRMTAGTGIRHSEFNPSATEAVHLYQIWLLPERPGLTPSYEQRTFNFSDKRNHFCLIAARNDEHAMTIHQDAKIYLAAVDSGQSIAQPLSEDRYAWLQVLSGRIRVQDHALQAGDGLAISNERELQVLAEEQGEMMLFDLA